MSWAAGPGGLSEQAARRRERDRAAVPVAPAVFARAFAAELSNPLTPILAGGAALSAAVGSVLDAGLVMAVSAVSAVTGSLQRVATDRAVAELFARSAVSVRVRRAGKEQQRLGR